MDHHPLGEGSFASTAPSASSVIRPAAEVVAQRTLPKTGIREIDEEMVLAFMCVSRMERKVNDALVGKAHETQHYIESPGGHLIDIGYRADMGAQPDEALHTREALLLRTDHVVALGALKRAAQASAAAVVNIRETTEAREALEERCRQQEAALEATQRRMRFLEQQLEQLATPGAVYDTFRGVWDNQAADGHANTTAAREALQTSLQVFDRERTSAQQLQAEAGLRGAMLERVAGRTDAAVGALDPQHIASVVGVPASEFETVHDTVGASKPAPDLVDSKNGDADDQNAAMTERQQKVLQEQQLQCDTHLEHRVEGILAVPITSERQAAELVQDCDKPVQFSMQAESQRYVIRRTVASRTERSIRAQGSSSSIIGKIVTAILYAPASSLQLEVDMRSTLGRQQQLAQQAADVNFGSVWAEMNLYQRPYVQVVHVGPGAALEGQALHRDFDVRPLLIDYDDDNTVKEFDERRAQHEKRLAFRRLNDSIASSRHFVVSERELKAAAAAGATASSPVTGASSPAGELREYTTQIPGILYHVATSGGRHAWRDPIDAGAVRCTASSVVRPATIAAIVAPFRDRYSHYFCTREAPGQYVTVAFDHMLVMPTGYSLASTHPIHGGEYPRHWRLEGSLDGIRWSTLQQHRDDVSLSRYAPTWTWALPRSAQTNTFYSHFRVVSEGPNAAGGDALCISSLEIYGKLVFVTKDGQEDSTPVTPFAERPRRFAPCSALPVPHEPKKVVKGKKK